MHIAVLGNAGSWYVADLERAATVRGDRCTRMDYRQLTARVLGQSADSTQNPKSKNQNPISLVSPQGALDDCDAVLVRTMPPGSLEQVVFRMDALLTLESRGVVVVNPPRAVECAVDKYLCTSRLAAAGLPTPETIVCEDSDAALAAFAELGGDVVVKPIFGSEGRGILRLTDPDLALRAFRTLERIDAVIYVQRFVEHEGFDVRVLVLDGCVLGGMKRSNSADFRTNVSRKARTETHPVTDREADLALRATRCVGARFAGVDLLYDRRGGCHVIEVNAVPGWKAFQRTTGIDVAGELLNALHCSV
ncbi:MAG: RimK family alpha-L-glutamate ligase [Planctomycetaceae bacterium]